MFRITLLARIFIAISLSCSISAIASPIQFFYTGLVTYTDGTLSSVANGDLLTGTFSYDPSITPSYATGNSVAQYELGSLSQISASVGGYYITTSDLLATVLNNASKYPLDSVNIESNSSPVFVNGSIHADSSFGINFASKSIEALNNTNLPLTLELAAFDAWTTGGLYHSQSIGGSVLEFKINSVSSVPEPSISAMYLLAIFLLPFITRSPNTENDPPA